MKYASLTLLALMGIVFFVSQDASAQLAANKVFSLTGSGFAASTETISGAGIDLLFSTNQQKNKIDLTLQSGLITLDGRELTLSEPSGTILKNGNIFKFSAEASDSEGKKYTFKAVGKLVDKTSKDSIYSLSGTLGDSTKATKLVFTTKASESTLQIDVDKVSGTTIKILSGSSNPNTQSYIGQQIGFRFQFFSMDRLTIPPGTSVTFVNEDTVSHSLKSGSPKYQSSHKDFTADGRVSSGEIKPGKSWTVTFDEIGLYRLFDEKYQWMDMTVFVIDASKLPKLKTPYN
jgi:plastocyanin